MQMAWATASCDSRKRVEVPLDATNRCSTFPKGQVASTGAASGKVVMLWARRTIQTAFENFDARTVTKW
jgi:hypothetical protein